MMITKNQFYEQKCQKLLEDKQLRFVGVINKLGNLIAGGFSNEVVPYYTEEKSRMLYMQMALEISMRRDFDVTLGEIDYIASKRKNVLMISIPLDNELLLISADPRAITEKIVSNAIKTLKIREENNDV